MKLSRFYLRVRKALRGRGGHIFAGLTALAEQRAADYSTQAAKPFWNIIFGSRPQAEYSTVLHKRMRFFMRVFLLLFATYEFVEAAPAPKIYVKPNNAVVITDTTLVQYGSSVLISGDVRRSNPWSGTGWGYVEISLFDQSGGLIKRIAANYFPRPIPHSFQSAYQPRSRFSVTVNAVAGQPFRAVEIAYRDRGNFRS
jgi:hypothetical protein